MCVCELTFLVLVGVGDILPLVGAQSLGGNILAHSLCVREDFRLRAVSFHLEAMGDNIMGQNREHNDV